jgi:hypothetical protein
MQRHHMLFADAMERADDAALDDRPEALDRARMTAQTQTGKHLFDPRLTALWPVARHHDFRAVPSGEGQHMRRPVKAVSASA